MIMSFIKFIAGIVVIFLVALAAGMLLPSKVTISKFIVINATHDSVKNQIADFNNWKNWYPAFRENEVSVQNNPGENVLQKVSLKTSSGKPVSFELLKSVSDTVIVRLAPWKVNYEFLLLSDSHGQTKIIWDVNTSLGNYPWNRIKGVFLDKISGPQYEAALQNLKKVCEKG
jgi:Polyketide cyclase / dehydrase and lipid transport